MKDVADIRCFTDEECTKELAVNANEHYTLLLAPPEGVDGYNGESHITRIYLKNIGRRPAHHIQLAASKDYAVYKVTFDKPLIEDMMEQEVVPVDVTITVPRWSDYSICYPTIVIDYYTLPPIYEGYNPYTAKREFWVSYGCDCPTYQPIGLDELQRLTASSIEGLISKIDDLTKSMPCLDQCSNEKCSMLLFSPIQVTVDVVEDKEE